MIRIQSGISIREEQVKSWLKGYGFKGEYLLVSTKPDSIYSKRLARLKDGQKLVVDLYTPIFLEKELTLSKWKPQDWITRQRNKKMVKRFLVRGNHFLVANRRQREYWLKTAKDLGVYLEVNDISVLPTGDENAQRSTLNAQSSERRNVVLWFGGIYPWMDPDPLIEAFSKLAIKFPDWKLRFLGSFHPETGYRKRYEEIKKLAFLKISQKQVEFIPWQEGKDLYSYFADVAVSVHLVKSSPEDYYSHRVRLLTLSNYGIPIFTSGNDIISELAVSLKMGIYIDDNAKVITKILSELMTSPVKFRKIKPTTKVQEHFLKQEMDIKIE